MSYWHSSNTFVDLQHFDSGYSNGAEDTLIGAKLVQKMLQLVRFEIKRGFCILSMLTIDPLRL